MKKIIILICCFLLASGHLCFGQNKTAPYKVVNKFNLPGNGFWDYLTIDENTGRLFVSHNNITQVVDSKTGKLIGTIENTQGVHGITLDHGANKAFISCGRDGTVTVVDLRSLQFITKVKVTGIDPDAILYDEFSDRVFVYNGRSSNATVIDAKTNKVIATIPLAGKPEFSVSDEQGKVYVNIEDKALVAVINSKTLKVENEWSLAPGEEPSGLALDNETHRLFSVCSNKKMIVLDAMNGKLIKTLAIGLGTDGCAFDPEFKQIYSSNGEGTLTVVKEETPNKFVIIQTIPTSNGARTICIDKRSHHLYLPTAQFGPAPKPTQENPHPWPTILPGTFSILEIAKG